MSLLEAVVDLVKSVWDTDRAIREESLVGESEFERRNGAVLRIILILVLVVAIAIGIGWLFR